MIDKNKKFFIIEKIHYENIDDSYYVYDRTMYDLTTAVKKLLALDTLNEDRKTTSYHLQEVNFSNALSLVKSANLTVQTSLTL